MRQSVSSYKIFILYIDPMFPYTDEENAWLSSRKKFLIFKNINQRNFINIF